MAAERPIKPAPIVRVSERTRVTHRGADFEPYWGETVPAVEVSQLDWALSRNGWWDDMLLGDWT